MTDTTDTELDGKTALELIDAWRQLDGMEVVLEWQVVEEDQDVMLVALDDTMMFDWDVESDRVDVRETMEEAGYELHHTYKLRDELDAIDAPEEATRVQAYRAR